MARSRVEWPMRRLAILVLLAAACSSPAEAPPDEASSHTAARTSGQSRTDPTPPPLPPPPAPSAALLDVPAPPTIELLWPGVSPRPEDHALALFVEDEWNNALACPRARAAPAPFGFHRCRFEGSSTLEVGGKRLWVAASEHGHEHEGMQFEKLDAVILAPFSDGVRPLYTFRALDLSIEDCGSSLSMRRLQAIDLDGDDRGELCVESVSEEGVGLFHVMDLEEAQQPWKPLHRKRDRVAFQLDPARLTLARRPDLDPACPPRGYHLPTRFKFGYGAFRERFALQGDPLLGRCPPKGSTHCLPELCARAR